jgi:hypothetical protein
MPHQWDDRALESIPLKLIVVAVVASMSVLPAAKAFAGLESHEFVRRAEIQLDRLVTASEILTVQGPGNVRTLDLDFSSDSDLAFQKFMIGDRPGGPNESCAMLILSNGGVMTRLASNPYCTICSTDRGPFHSYEACFSIRMTSAFENRTTVVLVEMV